MIGCSHGSLGGRFLPAWLLVGTVDIATLTQAASEVPDVRGRQ